MSKYTIVICTSCRRKTNRGVADPCKRGCPRCRSPVVLAEDGVRQQRARKQHRRSISVTPEAYARLEELQLRRMMELHPGPEGYPSISGLAETAIHALCDAEGVPRVDRHVAIASRLAAADRQAAAPVPAETRAAVQAVIVAAVHEAAASKAERDDDDMPELLCSDCGGPANGPDDAECVNCDCGAVVCSACCEAFEGVYFCSDCAAEKRAAARVVATEPIGGVHTW